MGESVLFIQSTDEGGEDSEGSAARLICGKSGRLTKERGTPKELWETKTKASEEDRHGKVVFLLFWSFINPLGPGRMVGGRLFIRLIELRADYASGPSGWTT